MGLRLLFGKIWFSNCWLLYIFLLFIWLTKLNNQVYVNENSSIHAIFISTFNNNILYIGCSYAFVAFICIFISSFPKNYRSSVGPDFARKRATIFLVLSMVFIAVGVGVTVSNLKLCIRLCNHTYFS